MVTRSSGDNEIVDGKVRRRKRAPLTRGLNRNHNPLLKNVFKAAANAAAAAKKGPLKDLYLRTVAGGGSRRDGQAHSGPQAGRCGPAAVEERRALGSDETDYASDIAARTTVGRRVRVTRSMICPASETTVRR